jgi:hypothetical protein
MSSQIYYKGCRTLCEDNTYSGKTIILVIQITSLYNLAINSDLERTDNFL